MKRTMNAAERDKYLGAVRIQHATAFDAIAKAGAGAICIVSIVEIEGQPMQPAVCAQIFKADECSLSIADVTEAVLRGILHGARGPQAEPWSPEGNA